MANVAIGEVHDASPSAEVVGPSSRDEPIRTARPRRSPDRSSASTHTTGGGLRATGLGYDLRKARPYCGYENFDFEVPTGTRGDAYDRLIVRVEEMRQSVRIIRQCLDNMPSGPYKADHPLPTPPPKERTLEDIDTTTTHCLPWSWGPGTPAGAAGEPGEGAGRGK